MTLVRCRRLGITLRRRCHPSRVVLMRGCRLGRLQFFAYYIFVEKQHQKGTTIIKLLPKDMKARLVNIKEYDSHIHVSLPLSHKLSPGLLSNTSSVLHPRPFSILVRAAPFSSSAAPYHFFLYLHLSLSSS
jgi:hypothetical protein